MAGFVETYGPWAVVAGGSEGIGAAFAQRLRTEHGVRVREVALDLARPDLLTALAPHVDDLEVGRSDSCATWCRRWSHAGGAGSS